MTNYSDVRIFLCTTPTDMHYSFDRLLGRTREIFEQDPLDGHLFLFVNRNRDRLKLLFWDHDGLRRPGIGGLRREVVLRRLGRA